MLYGDDDTQFFLDGALRLAKDFDPNLPWFITGKYNPLTSGHSDDNFLMLIFLPPQTSHALKSLCLSP